MGFGDSGDALLRLTGGGNERVSTKQFLQTVVGVLTVECLDSAVDAAEPVFVAHLNRVLGAHDHLPQRSTVCAVTCETSRARAGA